MDNATELDSSLYFGSKFEEVYSSRKLALNYELRLKDYDTTWHDMCFSSVRVLGCLSTATARLNNCNRDLSNVICLQTRVWRLTSATNEQCERTAPEPWVKCRLSNTATNSYVYELVELLEQSVEPDDVFVWRAPNILSWLTACSGVKQRSMHVIYESMCFQHSTKLHVRANRAHFHNGQQSNYCFRREQWSG